MLTKTIEYKNPTTGEQSAFTAYFNLTKAECIELNIRTDLDIVGKSQDQNQIMDTFQRIMRLSYGVRDGEGNFLKRTPQGGSYFDIFASTEAYSELFMELFTSQEYALEFIKAILPADIQTEEGAQTTQAENIPGQLRNHPSLQGFKGKAVPEPKASTPVPVEEPDIPAATVDPDYQEYLDFKKKQAEQAAQTTPDRVSQPENPQTDTPPVDESLV